MPNRKDRFKPRAEAGLLSKLIQEAWGAYQDSVASPEEQARVGEAIAVYYETLIPASDLEVLGRHNCVAHHDRCNVRVYDRNATDGAYAEAFGVELPRKIPVVGKNGYGYPAICACEPEWGTKSPLRAFDPYFAGLLALRKAYLAEYKASGVFPQEHKAATGEYPTWGEIEDRFPVLGAYLMKHREAVEK